MPSIKFCLSALCFAAVTYNGLILSTALYSVILAPIQVGDSGRLPVEKTFFAADPDLGWTQEYHRKRGVQSNPS